MWFYVILAFATIGFLWTATRLYEIAIGDDNAQ